MNIEKIKKEFPIFDEKIQNIDNIYESFTVFFEMGPYCNMFLKKICSTLT